MSRVYEIAKYLTEEQKAKACRYYYRKFGRTDDGYCPLGAAFYSAFQIKAPLAFDVALAVELPAPASLADEQRLFHAITVFMRDWDAMVIPSLSEALDYHPVPF